MLSAANISKPYNDLNCDLKTICTLLFPLYLTEMSFQSCQYHRLKHSEVRKLRPKFYIINGIILNENWYILISISMNFVPWISVHNEIVRYYRGYPVYASRDNPEEYGWTLAQAMACCLTASSYHITQGRLIIEYGLWLAFKRKAIP